MMRSRYRLPGEIGGDYHFKKIDSSDNTKVARFFRPVVSTKNTDKVAETRTGDDGEDVEHIIGKDFQP